MTTTYTLPYWAIWSTFRAYPATARWTGSGTREDPWMIAPEDDVWGWLTGMVDVHAQRPWAVSLMFCYTRHEQGGILTAMTVTALPIPANRKHGTASKMSAVGTGQ
jgi:hypothetical protein